MNITVNNNGLEGFHILSISKIHPSSNSLRLNIDEDYIAEVVSASFIDDDVNWGSTYTYYIKANYISGMSSQQTPTSITLGSPYCDGLFGDEEFCFNNNGYSCNEDNEIYLFIS